MREENSAPVAQLDRVPGYEPGGREFESLRARHTNTSILKFGGVVGNLRPSIHGWPFEFIGFLIAQNDVNGLTHIS